MKRSVLNETPEAEHEFDLAQDESYEQWLAENNNDPSEPPEGSPNNQSIMNEMRTTNIRSDYE